MKKIILLALLASGCEFGEPLTGEFIFSAAYSEISSTCKVDDGSPFLIGFRIINEEKVSVMNSTIDMFGEVKANSIYVEVQHPDEPKYMMILDIEDFESKAGRILVQDQNNPFCFTNYPGEIIR